MKFNTSAQNHRGFFRLAKVFILYVILLCTLLPLASCGPCSTSGMQKLVDYDACRSYSNNHNVGLQDMSIGDVSSGYVPTNSLTSLSLENVCSNSDLFCFPSTLPGFSSEERVHDLEAAILEVSATQSNDSLHISSHPWKWVSNSSWSSDSGMFKLVNGRTISCSLTSRDDMHDPSSFQTSTSVKNDLSSCRGPLVNQKGVSYRTKKSEKIVSGYSEEISSVHVEINPPLIDWGQKYLYFPSVAFLTVENTHNGRSLHVYEPFSTDIQFYSCNLSEVVLGPGEVASICFVFLPRRLGLSSAHLVLQTSSGGFVVQAKGFAIDSPYGIQPLMGMDASSSGRWSKNLSLFNPFDEVLYVEEVTTWVSISSGNTLHTAEATCAVENNWGYDELMGGRDRLDVRSGRFGFPVMTMRPHRNWEIGSRNTETLIEMDFSLDYEGNVFGFFCMQLVRSSQDKSDIVMVPLEAEVDGKAIYDDLISSVSVSLEALVPCDASETIGVAISLRNDAPSILTVVKISEVTDTKLFQIKYIEGLILFPGSVTQVAVASYTPLPKPAVNMNCKLLVLTNESSSPQIEIPCQDIISSCSRHQLGSSVGYKYQIDMGESSNTRTGSLGSGMQFPSRIKALETAEADELVLGNWKSQGTSSGLSVLDDHEVLFPMVQVGAHLSKWITVKNPSQLPVVMQMILNSGQIIDECRGLDGFLHPPSSNLVHTETTSPSRYGFSIAENALTEAYVHPHGRASFGPIFFHPSNRCGWRSSALIRNNLSGVEWTSLRGFGGSLSLILIEDSEPVESLEFNFNYPIGLNISPSDMLIQMEHTNACSQPLSKEVFAKNTGDLPLYVRRIEVSGTECRLDGFLVHSCKSFSLGPGESAKLLISYQTDFSGAIVHRDLELALANGILVIPMKASLPLSMLNFCKKSMFWMKVRKSSVAILLTASLMFLVFGCIVPHVVAWGSRDLFKGEESSIATIRIGGKSSRAHRNQRNDKFSVYTKMNCLLGSVEKEESSLLGSLDDNVDGHGVTPNLGITSQHAKFARSNQEQSNNLLDAHKEKTLPSSLLSKSVSIENSDLLEVSQSGNLTVRVGKDKGRRRRRRKGAGAGLTSLFDVSSSQSGNSTPSSPLSPVTSLTPNRTSMFAADVDQPVKARNPFTQVAAHHHCEKGQVFEVSSKANKLEHEVSMKDCNNNWLFSTQEQPDAQRKPASKPVLLPSATFPCTGRRAPSVLCPSDFLAPSPSIAPHARAPGSNLYNQKTVLGKEKAACGDEFTYDIWGDHFSGLHLMGRSKEVPAMMSRETESSSVSFFVRGPQTLKKSDICKFLPSRG